MTAPDPRDVLRTAAAQLREMAAGFGAEHYWQKDIDECEKSPALLSDAAVAWARTFGPRVGEPLAAWLENTALWIESEPRINDKHALDFARLITQTEGA